MKAIRNWEKYAGSFGEAVSDRGFAESPPNLVLVIPASHASVDSEKNL